MNEEKPASSWKRAVGWSFVGCGGLLAIVAIVVMLAAWRTNSALHQKKADVVPLLNKFTECFYRDDTACLKSITTWDDATLGGASAMAIQTGERLGVRGKATPIDKTWSMKTFASTTARTSSTIRVELDVAYANDPHVIEVFEIVDDERGSRVRSFRVNSPKVFVDPKKAPNATAR